MNQHLPRLRMSWNLGTKIFKPLKKRGTRNAMTALVGEERIELVAPSHSDLGLCLDIPWSVMSMSW